jgi:hypothetical protein
MEIDQPCLEERQREHVARMDVRRGVGRIAAALQEIETGAFAPAAPKLSWRSGMSTATILTTTLPHQISSFDQGQQIPITRCLAGRAGDDLAEESKLLAEKNSSYG